MYKSNYLGRVKAEKPIVSGDNLIINLPNFCENIKNGDCADVIICCNFDYPECIGNIVFVANGVNFVAIKIGLVKTDQICKRTMYRLVFGTEFNTVTIQTSLPCSKYPFPVVEVPTMTYAASGKIHPFIKK